MGQTDRKYSVQQNSQLVHKLTLRYPVYLARIGQCSNQELMGTLLSDFHLYRDSQRTFSINC